MAVSGATVMVTTEFLLPLTSFLLSVQVVEIMLVVEERLGTEEVVLASAAIVLPESTQSPTTLLLLLNPKNTTSVLLSLMLPMVVVLLSWPVVVLLEGVMNWKRVEMAFKFFESLDGVGSAALGQGLWLEMVFNLSALADVLQDSEAI